MALLKTDRRCAIATLEEFIKSSQNDFDTWNAAYSLGKIFAPGNRIAIAVLEKLVTSIRHESLRTQAADSLGKVDTGNPVAIAALIKIIESTKKDSICRKAAYSLGKIDPGNAIAISTLEKIITTTTHDSLRRQAAENLWTISPAHGMAIPVVSSNDKYNEKSVKTKSVQNTGNNTRLIPTLVEGIASAKDEDTKRRRACRLAKADPGNSVAFSTLIHLMKSATSELVRKIAADNLKKIILDEQMPELIASLKDCFSDEVNQNEWERFRHCYKLIWHCAEKISYPEFYQAWHQEID